MLYEPFGFPSSLFASRTTASVVKCPYSYLLPLPLNTGSGFPEAVTVTRQDAVLPPSAVFAVIVAVPAVFAVTAPFADTDATHSLLLLHATALFVAFSGVITALRGADVSPVFRASAAGTTVTEVTATVESASEATFTVHTAFFPL